MPITPLAVAVGASGVPETCRAVLALPLAVVSAVLGVPSLARRPLSAVAVAVKLISTDPEALRTILALPEAVVVGKKQAPHLEPQGDPHGVPVEAVSGSGVLVATPVVTLTVSNVTLPLASLPLRTATPLAVVVGAKQAPHGDPHGEPQGVPL